MRTATNIKGSLQMDSSMARASSTLSREICIRAFSLTTCSME